MDLRHLRKHLAPKKASSKGATGGKKSKSKGGSTPTTKSANKQY